MSSASPPAFKVENDKADVVLTTAQLVASVSLSDGAVRFSDATGKPLLAEDAVTASWTAA